MHTRTELSVVVRIDAKITFSICQIRTMSVKGTAVTSGSAMVSTTLASTTIHQWQSWSNRQLHVEWHEMEGEE